jgi:hypothetical protein
VSDADSDLASEHGEVDEELCPSGAIPFALLPYICGASYAMNYSAPSILPYVVSAYAEAEREQSLLWMLVLQSTGDVAGRVLSDFGQNVGKYCAALLMPLIYGLLVACAWWPETVHQALPFGMAIWALPACTFTLTFSNGHLVTGLYLQNQTDVDPIERQERALAMGFFGQVGAVTASLTAFLFTRVLAERAAAEPS